MTGTAREDFWMIDAFSLFLSHGLILIACWRLLSRPDLDSEKPAAKQPVNPNDA